MLPKGFARIRNFGFLANRHRAKLLPLCFATLDAVPTPKEPETPTAQPLGPCGLCPKCGGPMLVRERLTHAQIQLLQPRPRLSWLQLPHEVAIYIPKTSRASPRYAALRFAARPIASCRVFPIPKATLLPSPLDCNLRFAPPLQAQHSGVGCNLHFPALNSHRPASAATASGFLLTALSNARVPTLSPPHLMECARPIKHLRHSRGVQSLFF